MDSKKKKESEAKAHVAAKSARSSMKSSAGSVREKAKSIVPKSRGREITEGKKIKSY